MESRLKDCVTRKTDNSFCVDIKQQIFRYTGVYFESKPIIFKRDIVINDKDNKKNYYKLEIIWTINCKQCGLTIGYKHEKDINKCTRIFIFEDAISNDPMIVHTKIAELQQSLAIAKGLINV